MVDVDQTLLNCLGTLRLEASWMGVGRSYAPQLFALEVDGLVALEADVALVPDDVVPKPAGREQREGQ